MILNTVKTAQYSFTNNWQTFFLHSMLINHGGWWWWSGQWGGGRGEEGQGGRGKSKKEFEITCFGIVCRSGFLTQLHVTDVRRKKIILLWSTVRKRALVKVLNMGDLKHLCVCRRMKLLWRCTIFMILYRGACRDVREWDRDVFKCSFFWSWCVKDFLCIIIIKKSSKYLIWFD